MDQYVVIRISNDNITSISVIGPFDTRTEAQNYIDTRIDKNRFVYQPKILWTPNTTR